MPENELKNPNNGQISVEEAIIITTTELSRFVADIHANYSKLASVGDINKVKSILRDRDPLFSLNSIVIFLTSDEFKEHPKLGIIQTFLDVVRFITNVSSQINYPSLQEPLAQEFAVNLSIWYHTIWDFLQKNGTSLSPEVLIEFQKILTFIENQPHLNSLPSSRVLNTSLSEKMRSVFST